MQTNFATLNDLLAARAAQQPDDRAYIFLSNRGSEEAVLTFAELDRRARAFAARLSERGRKGDRALLLFPPGLDFIVAFFGCQLAGIIAVPMMIPRRSSSRDSSASIVADCAPRFAIANPDLMTERADLTERFQGAGLEWLTLDSNAAPPAKQELSLPAVSRDDIAFLQYTSGSTSAPKGVIVTHANLLTNLEMIRIALSNTRRSAYVSWVPLYHDMGLIANVLQTLYLGSLCVLLAPVTFLQRPMTWLRAIHDYRAEVAGGPNFAFDLCVSRLNAEQMKDVDLSCWKLAFNAAEPIRADTIERFAAAFAPYGFDAQAIYPGYGMAEATLMISSGRRGAGAIKRIVSRDALQRHRAIPPANSEDAYVVIGCGQALAGERIAIVDPESRRALDAGCIGEVWAHGPHVAQGYWQQPEATASTFQARIEGQGDERWLRTGDLGFLDEAGELYITGRIKDLIIVRGINHYPQDIEHTVQNSHPALRKHGAAAFAVLDPRGAEKLVVVQEVERTQRHHISAEDIAGCIREAVVNEHDIAVDDVVLIRPGALPKTTSGKIQRNLTRQLWEQGLLETLGPPAEQPLRATQS
jgi:acyl-CoA synthetase (AMP-forming)/AMP-acid ligase II